MPEPSCRRARLAARSFPVLCLSPILLLLGCFGSTQGDSGGSGGRGGSGGTHGTGAMGGGGGQVTCTLDLRVAVRVVVQSPDGAPVDVEEATVAVDGGEARACDRLGPGTYACYEAGPGEYVVTLRLGDAQATLTAAPPHDACHVTDFAALTHVWQPSGPAACERDADCRVVDDACCSCGPPMLPTARAVAVDSNDYGTECDAVCGACPEEPQGPATLAAVCLNGGCAVVDVYTQPQTLCEVDTDCVLADADCCGTCGDWRIDDVFAVRIDSAWHDERCARRECPLYDCPAGQILAEAHCTAAGRCAAREVAPLP